jgi:hypothetical protein
VLRVGISETHSSAIEEARTTTAKVAGTPTTEMASATAATEMAATATATKSTAPTAAVTGRPCCRAEQQGCDANYAN